MGDINIILVFLAGVLSFVSPCSLPLYPAFLSYITGVSLTDVQQSKGMLQRKSLLHTLFFLLGFSLIFVSMGFVTSFLGQFFLDYSDFLRQIGAIVLVFFGLILTGILQFDFLNQEKRVQFSSRPSGYAGSALIGIAFAAGWMPCTGPILAGVIALAATNPSAGVVYMTFYVLGFAIPFFLLSFFIGRVSFIKKYSETISKIGGYLMIIVGILLFFDWMTKIAAFLTRLTGGFTGF